MTAPPGKFLASDRVILSPLLFPLMNNDTTRSYVVWMNPLAMVRYSHLAYLDTSKSHIIRALTVHPDYAVANKSLDPEHVLIKESDIHVFFMGRYADLNGTYIKYRKLALIFQSFKIPSELLCVFPDLLLTLFHRYIKAVFFILRNALIDKLKTKQCRIF